MRKLVDRVTELRVCNCERSLLLVLDGVEEGGEHRSDLDCVSSCLCASMSMPTYLALGKSGGFIESSCSAVEFLEFLELETVKENRVSCES